MTVPFGVVQLLEVLDFNQIDRPVVKSQVAGTLVNGSNDRLTVVFPFQARVIFGKDTDHFPHLENIRFPFVPVFTHRLANDSVVGVLPPASATASFQTVGCCCGARTDRGRT